MHVDESEINEAVASQEEHIKRNTSCRGVIGSAHAYRAFHGRGGQPYQACVVCGVPEKARPGAFERARVNA